MIWPVNMEHGQEQIEGVHAHPGGPKKAGNLSHFFVSFPFVMSYCWVNAERGQAHVGGHTEICPARGLSQI